MSSPSQEPHEPTASFDAGAVTRKLLFALYAAGGVLLLVELLYLVTGYDKHPYFDWEKIPGYYGLVAFAASLVLVVFARFVLRPLVRRDEDYYETTSPDKGGKTDA